MADLRFVVQLKDSYDAVRALQNTDLAFHYGHVVLFEVVAHDPRATWDGLSAVLPDSARRIFDDPKNADDPGVE